MYAKLVEGKLRRAPRKLPGDGVTVWNPPDAMYRTAGWKPVQFTEAPEAPDGFYYESTWEEQAEAIVQTWTLVALPPEEATDEDYAAALARLGVIE